MTGGTDELRLSIAWFETAKPNGPALGNSETTTWSNFASIFATWRREGEKGGLNFVPSRFEMEADGRHVRRQLANVIARTAVALDIETNGKTGEVPPPPEVAAARVQALGHAAVLYTSHNHEKAALRYRIILLLDQEIEPDITAPVFAAKSLDLGRRLRQVQNQQCGAVLSAFMSYGALDRHQTIVILGEPVGKWLTDAAAARKAEEERIADEAQKAAAARLAARIAAGFDPADSPIEKLRALRPRRRLDVPWLRQGRIQVPAPKLRFR
jgi:hypothetical protein